MKVIYSKTSMNNGITVTIVQSAQDLSSKLSGVLLPELSMTNNIVEHLTAIDILKKEIKMALRDNDISHSADIRMSKQCNDCRLSDCANFSILVFRSCCTIRTS